MALVVDAHQDIAYNCLNFDRDYAQSVFVTRSREEGRDKYPNGIATLGLPEAISGRVALSFATVFVAPKSTEPQPWDRMSYVTTQQAYALAQRQMDFYNRFSDDNPRVRLIRNQTDLDAVLATWAPGIQVDDHVQGWVLLMENAEPILEPPQFEEWYERGIRIVGPAWSFNRYTGGTGYPGGLTRDCYELLDIMASLGVILDLSHMAEQAYFEALERYEGVVIASHSNPRRFRNTDRHLSDDMIRALAERDGVMGVVLFNKFLSDHWTNGDRKDIIPFSKPVDVIDYICQLTGSAAHVGIGTDLDGGFGMESIPQGFDTIRDVASIGDALRERGYSEADIDAVLGGNMLRKLRQALPERQG